MSTAEVLVLHDAELLAEASAARLVTAVVEAQADGGQAQVCLTGGDIGIACLAALAASPSPDAIDWSALHVWWGDER
ncbi:MAG TPA: 6-phosphogluconolactonase, partial [Candidatus Angelobacter sp.]|nr:6-phosphogluconolactonase [Candidatus Angelobacter sp.]